MKAANSLKQKQDLFLSTDPLTGQPWLLSMAEARPVRLPRKLKFPTYSDGKVNSKALFEHIRSGLPLRRRASDSFDNPYRMWWDSFGPYSSIGSMFILQDSLATQAEKEKAAQRLAISIGRRFKDLWANEASVKFKPEEFRRQCEKAFLLAADRASDKDLVLRSSRFEPLARRILEEILVEEVFGHPLPEFKTRYTRHKRRNPARRDSDADLDALVDNKSESVLEKLIVLESERSSRKSVLALLGKISPKQAAFLRLALSHFDEHSADDAKTVFERTAKKLRLTPTHKRKIIQEIRAQARKS